MSRKIFFIEIISLFVLILMSNKLQRVRLIMKKTLIILITGISFLSLGANASNIKNEVSAIGKIANLSNQSLTVKFHTCSMTNMHGHCRYTPSQTISLAALGKPGSSVKVTVKYPKNGYGFLYVDSAHTNDANSNYDYCNTDVYPGRDINTIKLQDLGDGSILCDSGISRY